MEIFSFRSGYDLNQGQLWKSGTSAPSYRIDFTDGIASSSVSISACTAGAVNSSNSDVTSTVVSSVATSGAVVTVSLLTCGSGGTSPAVDGYQTRVRTTVTLSNNAILVYDNFVIVSNPTYGPYA